VQRGQAGRRRRARGSLLHKETARVCRRSWRPETPWAVCARGRGHVTTTPQEREMVGRGPPWWHTAVTKKWVRSRGQLLKYWPFSLYVLPFQKSGEVRIWQELYRL
jgi:hypothetical protein